MPHGNPVGCMHFLCSKLIEDFLARSFANQQAKRLICLQEVTRREEKSPYFGGMNVVVVGGSGRRGTAGAEVACGPFLL